MRLPSPRFLAAVLLLFGSTLYGQFQSGNIYGRVQAKDGSVLPGVTVTLTGIGAPQTEVTDSQGNFRFINLAPGAYALKAELAGYGTASRTGINVRIAANADVTLTLNPSVSESIVVTAEAPLVDVRKAGTGIDISKVELQNIPSARDPWVMMQQTPGVTLDRNNVGGNESGQQSVYVSKGSIATQATWNVDGVNITDFSATGSSPSYYDFDAFEEMQITTGGSDPRIQTPGIQMNMVTKRGTNDFKGSARDFYTSHSFQSTPSIPAEAQSYLSRINQINNIEDYGAEVGGPIWRDRVWFWGAFGEQRLNILSATLLSSGARFQDRTTLKNENGKLNAQLLPSNSLVVVDQYGAKVKLGRNVSTIRFPETGWNQNNYYGGSNGDLTNPTLWKVEDTQIIGSSLYLTGLYSQVQGGFQLIADNGKGCTTYACGIDSLPAYRDFAGDGAWHRTYESAFSDRPQKQARLDGSKFFNTGSMNHELKFGFGYRRATVASTSAWPGGEYVYNYGGGVGNGDTGTVALMRLPQFQLAAKSTDLYVGDTMLVGNLTVQAGLRYDNQRGTDGAGIGAANPVVPDILPAVAFSGVSGLKWTNLSPRIGLTYALGGNKQTLIRGSYNRYVDQLDSNTVSSVSPGAASYIYYYFNDANHDNIAQRNEIDFKAGNVGFRGFDPSNPATLTQFTRWDSNLKAPHTDEFILGGERQMFTDFSIGIDATYRRLNDFITTTGEKHQGQGDFYTSADYVAHAPVTATLPNGSQVPITYYVLAPGVAAPVYEVVRNRPDYTQTYKGLDVYATKRLSHRWMLRGNFTLQDWTQHAGPGAIVDPTLQRINSTTGIPGTGDTACPNCNGDVLFRSAGSGSKGNVYLNSKWSYSLTGTYMIPVIETSLGLNLNGRQGYALPYVYRVAAGAEGNKLVIVPSPIDQFRDPTVTELDLRLAKEIRFSRVGLTLSIDGFNMMNSNTILQRDMTRVNSSYSASNHVTEVLSPRVFRAGARLSF